MRNVDLPDTIERAANHALTISESGPLTERSPDGVRRPSAHRPSRESSSPQVNVSGTFRIGSPEDESVVQAYLLQESRHKEASAGSVQLAALSLRTLHCPEGLIQAVDRAAEDKLRHAAVLAQAAYRPRTVALPSCLEQPLTDLVGFTLDTATERCVAETYAAARFAFQAQKAQSPELCALFGAIAADDTRHAALFWDLLDWALSHLSPARARWVDGEQRLVRDALRHAVEARLPEELYTYAGVPDPDAGHALMDALEFQLWSEVAA